MKTERREPREAPGAIGQAGAILSLPLPDILSFTSLADAIHSTHTAGIMRNYLRKLFEILEIGAKAESASPEPAPVPPMDDVAFWYVINRCNNLCGSNERYYNELWSMLSEMDAASLAGFSIKVEQLRPLLQDWNTWAAAKLLLPDMPFDAFHGFQNWIISAGKEAFLKVAEHGDNIADALRIAGHRDLVFEGFDRIPAEVLSQKPEAEQYSFVQIFTGKSSTQATLNGDHWEISEANLASKFPKLSSLLGRVPIEAVKPPGPTLH